MTKRLIFPLVNGLAIALLMGLLGYYLNDLLRWFLIGFVMGVAVGLLAEVILKRLGERIYRRRVLLVVLLEIPLIVFFVAPFAYVSVLVQPNRMSPCCISPADFGSTYETFAIPAADGVTIAGWFIPPSAEHGATILILHGASSNRIGSMWHAEQLSRAGYGVVLYDQRALGESTGDQQSWGWLDVRDMPYILDYTAAQPNVNPQRIGGVGLSLGAHILVNAALENPRLAALWLDGLGAASLDDFPPAQDISDHFSAIINQMMIYSMDILVSASPPPSIRSVLPQLAPRPMIFIIGRMDDFEYQINIGYSSLLGENAEQWVIDGAGHGGGPMVAEDDYITRMIAFFDEALVEN